MRTAILISGYLRTFRTNLPKIQENIINRLKDVDIYIHLTKNENKEDIYLNSFNLEEDINYINNQINPISLVCEDNCHFSENKKINNTYNLWFKFFKLNELKKLNEETNNKKYDLVIKYRPDLDLVTTNIFNQDFEEDIIYLPKESVIDKNKLSNENDDYICDIFAYGNSHSMDRYFSIYDSIDELINSYGPVSETILYHHLINNNIKFKQLDIEYNVILSSCNIFAICGDSGSGKSTLGNILKKYFSNSFMLECDRYHKWERNDENWKRFTHLNPESNYLTKMNQDIFDLKVGNAIYQVDYDHKTGKFTDKEVIDSSDNIIVCGLHSLYTNDENIYDLKIYIDTEENLKNFWKIDRDTKYRGYTLEKSLKQIESRKEDYKKFIHPQREKSDLIINFYYDNLKPETFNENNISLKIYLKSNYNINFLLKKFEEIQFPCAPKLENNFYIFDFKKYEKIELMNINNISSLNNFYDYIMFIIINIRKTNF